MKLQDQHPFDSAILGLDNLYCTVGADSFFINSPCIRATDKTITIGKKYHLVDCPEGTFVKISDVQLLDGYYKEGIVHLFVEDIRAKRVLTIDLCIECLEKHCTWLLINSDYFNDEMNAVAIKSHCEKCTESKTKPTTDDNPKQSSDYDLLEFEL